MDMPTDRKTYTPAQKLKIVLECQQRDTTIEAVRLKYGVAKSVLHRWREHFNTQAAEAVFGDTAQTKKKTAKPGKPPPGESPAELKRLIGDLYAQLDVLKKVSELPDIR
jgi:transposase-like protein